MVSPFLAIKNLARVSSFSLGGKLDLMTENDSSVNDPAGVLHLTCSISVDLKVSFEILEWLVFAVWNISLLLRRCKTDVVDRYTLLMFT